MSKSEAHSHHYEDSLDKEIVMQRDAHFGGSFSVMLDYYATAGRGVDLRFETGRIAELAEEEKRSGQNLAALLLGIDEADEIRKAREAYKKLKQLYDVKSPKNPFPKLIADLILSEAEEPEEEIAAIVAQKGTIVPSLIDLIRSEDMYNPIYPGYGKAPFLAARCLGQIGDRRAIIALFESIGRGDFFEDDIALNALKAIGSPAKEFLLKVLHGKPLTEDNERAAIALIAFKDDEEVAQKSFALLKALDLKKELSLATYLVLASEGLQGKVEREEFENFAKRQDLPKELKNDCGAVLKAWNP